MVGRGVHRASHWRQGGVVTILIGKGVKTKKTEKAKKGGDSKETKKKKPRRSCMRAEGTCLSRSGTIKARLGCQPGGGEGEATSADRQP